MEIFDGWQPSSGREGFDWHCVRFGVHSLRESGISSCERPMSTGRESKPAMVV
jgi:hypothetical protein